MNPDKTATFDDADLELLLIDLEASYRDNDLYGMVRTCKALDYILTAEFNGQMKEKQKKAKA